MGSVPEPTNWWTTFPWAWFAVSLALATLACFSGLRDMLRRWFVSGGYYAHGPLVPLVCGWALWQERDRWARLNPRSWSLGFAPLVLAVPLGVVGAVEQVAVFQNGAFWLFGLGLLALYLGREALQRAWFVVGFSLFAIPLPTVAIEALTFKLKMLAAKVATLTIELAGIPAVLEGGTIHFESTSVIVDDVCSGLKTLITLLALACVFAYLQASRIKTGLVLALAIPVAIVTNVIRILILCYLASIEHPAAQEGPLHDATGLMVYALAVLCFMGIARLPLGSDEPPPLTWPSQEPPRTPSPLVRGLALLPLLLPAFVSVLVLRAEAGATQQETQVTAGVPGEIGDWISRRIELGEDVFRVLATRDVVFRRYRNEAHEWPVDFYLTYSTGDIFAVAHPPERCFTGGGFSVQSRREQELTVGADQALRANRFVFRNPEGETMLVYYWYRLNGVDVPSYVDYRFTSFLQRLSRYESSGSMIRLSTRVGSQGEEAAERRLRAFAAEALPEALSVVPARTE